MTEGNLAVAGRLVADVWAVRRPVQVSSIEMAPCRACFRIGFCRHGQYGAVPECQAAEKVKVSQFRTECAPYATLKCRVFHSTKSMRPQDGSRRVRFDRPNMRRRQPQTRQRASRHRLTKRSRIVLTKPCRPCRSRASMNSSAAGVLTRRFRWAFAIVAAIAFGTAASKPRTNWSGVS